MRFSLRAGLVIVIVGVFGSSSGPMAAPAPPPAQSSVPTSLMIAQALHCASQGPGLETVPVAGRPVFRVVSGNREVGHPGGQQREQLSGDRRELQEIDVCRELFRPAAQHATDPRRQHQRLRRGPEGTRAEPAAAGARRVPRQGRRISLPSGAIARLRIYQVGQRHYQLILEGPGDFVDSAEANQFFDSFKLIT